MVDSPYYVVPSTAFSEMQLEAGCLLTDFDFENPFDDPDESNILAVTSGGINPVCEPQYEDLAEDVDNVPNNTKEFLIITGYNCQLSFTSLRFNPDNIAWSIGAADVSTPTADGITFPTGTKLIKPRATVKAADFKDIYAAFPMANGDLYLCKLKNAISTGGLNVQTTKNGKGTNKVTLTGYISVDDVKDIPMEYYYFPKPQTTFTVTSAAGNTTGKTAITADYTLGTGETYVYKITDDVINVEPGDSTASGWTAWNGTDEITATTGKIITVAATKSNAVVASGYNTVTSKTGT